MITEVFFEYRTVPVHVWALFFVCLMFTIILQKYMEMFSIFISYHHHLSTSRSVSLYTPSWRLSMTPWLQRGLETVEPSRWHCLTERLWMLSPGRPHHTRWPVESGQCHDGIVVIVTTIWMLPFALMPRSKKREKPPEFLQYVIPISAVTLTCTTHSHCCFLKRLQNVYSMKHWFGKPT